ncbi:MAG: hypothetical protein DMG68_01390 [Acidobacteria bacterium]|nr:MAG: hypothetical protein DMG68_01390 [Acidobacteriota bacterium]TMD38371.1 MAG: hypothetical protein E6I88_14380 [Chloroflexota bacterium]
MRIGGLIRVGKSDPVAAFAPLFTSMFIGTAAFTLDPELVAVPAQAAVINAEQINNAGSFITSLIT